MRKFSVVLVAMILLLGWTYSVEACPDPPKCVCDCNAECRYGKICKKVKVCQYHKTCEMKKVCSDDKYKHCKSPKVKVCHIPPGNPTNAHTICIGKSAVVAHLGNHGDYLGECKPHCEWIEVCTAKKCCKYVTKCECRKYNPECPSCECPGFKPDAGVESDKGSQEPDGALTPDPDAFVPDPDSIVPQMDQSVLDPDSFVQQRDFGKVEPDAGVSEVDSRVLKSDSRVRAPDSCCVPVDPKKVTAESEEDMELIGGGCNVGNTGGTGLGIMLLLGLFALRRKTLSLVTALVMVFALSGTANATPSMNDDNDDYYSTKNADTLGHFNMNFSLGFEYIHRPLKIVTKPGGKLVETAINFRQNVNFTSSVGFGSWLQTDFVMIMMAGQSVTAPGNLNLDRSVEDTALGDTRFVPRVNFLRTGTFSLGLAADLTLPTGNADSFVGEDGATITPTLLAGLRTEHFQADLNVGYLARNDQSYGFKSQNVAVDDEFVYGFGVRIPLVKDYGSLHRLDLQGDLWGVVSIYEQDKEELPLEVMGGLQAHLKHGVVVTFGAGGGITKGLGTSQYRIMWGFGWEYDHPKPRPLCKDRKVYVPVVKRVPVVKEVTVINHHLILPPVFFAFDKNVILEQSYPTLQTVADMLKKYKNIKEVVLGGHTDARGSDEYNFDLGLRRATSVKKMLVKMGVNAKRMIAVTYGEWETVVKDAKTERDHARNRRVDFNRQ